MENFKYCTARTFKINDSFSDYPHDAYNEIHMFNGSGIIKWNLFIALELSGSGIGYHTQRITLFTVVVFGIQYTVDSRR